jgi:hypothetical protein
MTGMTRPRALLLDDGNELDRIAEALTRIGVAAQRYQGARIVDGLPMPVDLLITSGARARDLPSLAVDGPGGAPTWICVHTEDFHPLRDRLRELGVHYLVHTSTDNRTLDLVLGQLLHSGTERRSAARLPMGCEIQWQWKGPSRDKGQLLDLSEGSARILVRPDLPLGACLTLELPAQLAAKPVEVECRVTRCDPSYQIDRLCYAVAVSFESLEPSTAALIGSLVRGERIGTRVTPLARRPYVDGSGIPDWDEMAADGERRDQLRRRYDEHVDACSSDAVDRPVSALGRDLSIGGMRIQPPSNLDLEISALTTLSLHSGDLERPLRVRARVARREADGTLALVFEGLSDDERSAIEQILATLPPIAALDGLDQRVVATEIQRP